MQWSRIDSEMPVELPLTAIYLCLLHLLLIYHWGWEYGLNMLYGTVEAFWYQGVGKYLSSFKSSQTQGITSYLTWLVLHFYLSLKSESESCSVVSNSVTPWNPPGSSVHGILQARIPEWVAVPFSRRSSRPRVQTGVSCIAGRFFTSWATREALYLSLLLLLLSHFSRVRLCATP